MESNLPYNKIWLGYMKALSLSLYSLEAERSLNERDTFVVEETEEGRAFKLRLERDALRENFNHVLRSSSSSSMTVAIF